LGVKLTVPLVQIGPSLVGDATGLVVTVTVVVCTIVELQPDDVVVTVREYVLVTVGVAVVFAALVAARSGPAQTKMYVPVPPDALEERLTVPPIQMGPSFVGLAVGRGVVDTVLV